MLSMIELALNIVAFVIVTYAAVLIGIFAFGVISLFLISVYKGSLFIWYYLEKLLFPRSA